MSGGGSVSFLKSFGEQVSMSDASTRSATEQRPAVPQAVASVKQLSVNRSDGSHQPQNSIGDASAHGVTQQGPTVPKAIAVKEAQSDVEPDIQPPQPIFTDSESDGSDSVYSDDSCDENDMMTNVEQVTGFYSRATDRLQNRIMHRIKKSNPATLQSARMQELSELLHKARQLSDTMKTKQYKLIVIGKGYGKTDAANTLCGGMKVSTVCTLRMCKQIACCTCTHQVVMHAASTCCTCCNVLYASAV
jgi:hypothetical protein